MLKKMTAGLTVVGGLFLHGSFEAQADSKPEKICNTVTECEQIIAQAEARITGARQMILVLGRTPNVEPAEIRTTASASVFTPDSSHPALGEAWRDPSGLIWGEAVTEVIDGQRRVKLMVQSSRSLQERDMWAPNDRRLGALEYCQRMGANLPSLQDFDRLREYIGYQFVGTGSGYNAQVFVDFSAREWWIAPASPYETLATFFNGATGSTGQADIQSEKAFRCVAR